MASFHLEATATLVLRVASGPQARAILKVQGIPGSMDTLEAQMAASEPTLKEAPGAKEAMEGHTTWGQTLR